MLERHVDALEVAVDGADVAVPVLDVDPSSSLGRLWQRMLAAVARVSAGACRDLMPHHVVACV